jgi:hypothetical protein
MQQVHARHPFTLSLFYLSVERSIACTAPPLDCRQPEQAARMINCGTRTRQALSALQRTPTASAGLWPPEILMATGSSIWPSVYRERTISPEGST